MKKFFLFTFLFLFFLLNAGAVLALEVQYPTILGFSIDETSGLPEYARYFFNLGIYIAGGLAAMVLVFGGIYYLISFLSGSFKDEAKDWIKSGITGLLLVMSAWLIAWTINPDLVKFRLDDLPPNYFDQTGGTNNPNNPKTTTYNAIPVGTSMENLLTGKMDCYDFDAQGDPISAVQDQRRRAFFMPGVNAVPGNVDHDRVDCILKLLDGAQKKYQAISKLSAQLIELMKKCKCDPVEQGEGEEPREKCQKGCQQCGEPVVSVTTLPDGSTTTTKTCENLCAGISCQPDRVCCDTATMNQIEHGPIRIKNCEQKTTNSASAPRPDECCPGTEKGTPECYQDPCPSANECCGAEKDYKGLDEFRSPLVLSDGSSFVKNLAEPGGDGLINVQNWNNLKLIEQFAYFNEKIDEISEKIKEDKEKLSENKKSINSAQCYLSIAYADLLKKVNATNPDNEKINLTAGKDYSKYCEGFNYGTSSCFKKCQDACPSTSVPAVACYKSCDATCAPDDTKCINKKTACVADCINLAPCNFDSGPANFGECVTLCRTQCDAVCAKKYLTCSYEYKVCQDFCKEDSKCILTAKANECLIGKNPQNFVDCSIKQSDSGNGKFCVDNAFLCKYGSFEFSGYQECLDPKYLDPQDPSENCPSDQYSSSFLWKNKECQFCQDAYKKKTGENNICIDAHPETAKCPASSACPDCPCDIIDKTFKYSLPKNPCPDDKPIKTCADGTKTCVCGSHGEGGGGGGGGGGPCPGGAPMQTCADGTQSCFCPVISTYKAAEEQCQTTDPSKPGYCSPGAGGKCVDGECDYSNGGGGPNDDFYSIKISEYKITGPECLDYSFNDDPLTFYCEKDWWKDLSREGLSKTPLGETMHETKKTEIPVGQTIDNAEKWASDFLDRLDNLKQELSQELGKIYDVGTQSNYCRCDSMVPNTGPACASMCVLTTETLSESEGGGTKDECNPSDCGGYACQTMIDILSQMADSYRDMKKSYIDFFQYYLEKGLSGRGEILKQLTYSRQKTSTCGVSQINSEKEARLLSCQRVQDELISDVIGGKIIMDGKEIKSYCYGKKLNELQINDLTDNWFCVEKQANTETGSGGSSF